MDPVIETLVSAGPLGAVIVGLAVAFWRQSRALADVQKDRVEDAKKVTATLLVLNDKWNDTLNHLATVVDALKERR